MTYSTTEIRKQPIADAKNRPSSTESPPATAAQKSAALLAAIKADSSAEHIADLLSAKADPNTINPNGMETVLCMAAKDRSADIVAALLQARANPWLTYFGRRTPLEEAARRRPAAPEIVSMLTEVTTYDSKGYESQKSKDDGLLLASQSGDAYKVTMLLHLKAEPYVYDASDNTPLMLAASSGHAEAVKALTNAEHFSHYGCRQFQAALTASASNGHMECTKALAELHAHAVITDTLPATHLSISALAKEQGHMETAEFLAQLSKNGQLTSAVSKNDTVAVQQFLKAKADVNARSYTNTLTLLIAVDNNNIPLVKLLLAHNADPNITSIHIDRSFGRLKAPLALAAEKGNAEIVSLLLQAKTVITTDSKPSKIYEDAALMAKLKRHSNITVILEEAYKNIKKKECRTATLVGLHPRAGASSLMSKLKLHSHFDPQVLRVPLQLADLALAPVKLSPVLEESDEALSKTLSAAPKLSPS